MPGQPPEDFGFDDFPFGLPSYSGKDEAALDAIEQLIRKPHEQNLFGYRTDGSAIETLGEYRRMMKAGEKIMSLPRVQTPPGASP